MADGTAVEPMPHAVYVAPLPDGPILVFEGVAALVWDAVTTLDREDVVDEIAEQTASVPADIRATVDTFIADLIDRALIAVEAPPRPVRRD